MLKRWPTFTRFLADGRICLTNNAAERAMRGIAIGRRNWTFAGSDRGADRAAALYTLIETARLNDVDPRAWLEDVLRRINDHPAHASTNSCPGTGKPKIKPTSLPDQAGLLLKKTELTVVLAGCVRKDEVLARLVKPVELVMANDPLIVLEEAARLLATAQKRLAPVDQATE